MDYRCGPTRHILRANEMKASSGSTHARNVGSTSLCERALHTSPRRDQNLLPRKVVHDLRASFGDHEHVFQTHTADASLAFTTFDGDRHAFFENLRVVERPEPVDDRD